MAKKSAIDLLNAIINPTSKVPGVQNSATQTSDGNNDVKLDDDFIDSIKNAAKQIGLEKDCTKGVFNWVNNLNNGLSTNSSLLSSTSSMLQNKLLGNGFGDQICFTMTKYSTVLDFYIENVLKQVLILYSRIDNFKGRLESALNDFSNDIKGCMITSLLDTKNLYNSLINKYTKIDYTQLVTLMESCPCVEEILSTLFKGTSFHKCFEDNKGNPSAIVSCLSELSIIDLDAISCYVNTVIDDIIRNTLDGFNKFQDLIKFTLDRLLAPMRTLVKQYCLLLTKKYDLTLPLKVIKKQGFGCLFIHTIEKKRGREYPAMSVMDMIATYKLWVNCMEHICPELSKDKKLQIKELNEKLRLNWKYWNDPNIADIFISCLGVANDKKFASPSTIREMFISTPKSNAKKIFTDTLDVFKTVGKLPSPSKLKKKCVTKTDANGNKVTVSEEVLPGFENYDPNTFEPINPILDSVVKSTGIEDDNYFGQKSLNENRIFYPQVEELVISMINNMGSVIEQDFYGSKKAKFEEFIYWDKDFTRTQKHIDSIIKVQNKAINNAKSSTVLETKEQIEDPQVIVPTYVIENDYTELRKIEPPTINQNENKLDYYSRWFASATT